MDSTENKIQNVATKDIKSVYELKESTAVLLITVITLIIILIALLYYFYYSGLRRKNCKTMDGIYGDLNGKIKAIDNSEQFNYTFKDYYIKSTNIRSKAYAIAHWQVL